MKTCIALIVLALGLSGPLKAQTTTAAPHGGSLKLAGYYKIEFVDCYEYVEIYLYELDMCPILNHGLSGHIDLHFPGKECFTAGLYPYGVDAFTAGVEQHCYTSCTVELHGIGFSLKTEFSGFNNDDENCRPAKIQVRN